MNKIYSFIFYFLIPNIDGDCLEFSHNNMNSAKHTCQLKTTEHNGFRKCLSCFINRPILPFENITITQQCSPVVELHCVEFYFNDTESFLQFSYQYAEIINKLFDRNIPKKMPINNALFIHIEYDSMSVFSLQTIQPLENIFNRNFNDLGLIMKNRGNLTTLMINSNIRNTTFRAIQLYINCGDDKGWNMYDYVRRAPEKQRSEYIKCAIPTSASTTFSQSITHTQPTTYTASSSTTKTFKSHSFSTSATINSTTNSSPSITNRTQTSSTTKTSSTSISSTTVTTTISNLLFDTTEDFPYTQSITNTFTTESTLSNTTENYNIITSSHISYNQTEATLFSSKTSTSFITVTFPITTMSINIYNISKSTRLTQQKASKFILILFPFIAISLLSCLLIAFLICTIYQRSRKRTEDDEDEEDNGYFNTPSHFISSKLNAASIISSQWHRTSF